MDKKTELGIENLEIQKEKLLGWVGAEIAQGMCEANLEALGKVTDMIKDLAEAVYYCAEAEEKKIKSCYYKAIIHAMKENEEDDEEMDEVERYGYDNYRYASTGQFAPKGKGTRYGYSARGGRRVSGGNRGGSNVSSGNRSSNMGYPMIPMQEYDEFGVPTKPHAGGPWYYHEGEGGQMTEKEQMHHAMDNMKEMWNNADPELKREMKNDMTNLVNDIPV